MKTQAKKQLNFKKNNIIELNENSLSNINGGSDNGFEGDVPPIGPKSRYTSWLCNGVN
ncbi:hypothetical protein [Lacinutrix sp.]|uniref:hypothetical protein n=1 Tax=Lacinutrix sp. TaxID=1937692 RepID=UPI0025B85927|nr:hypothetical protein [Lacinutrix sp.]